MNHTIKTCLGGLVLGILASGIYFLLPGGTPLLHVAYGAVLVALLLMVVATLVVVQRLRRAEPQHFVFPLIAWQYFMVHLVVSAMVLALDAFGVWSMPWGLFCVLHGGLLAWFLVKLLAVAAGQEAIEEVQATRQAAVGNWRMLVLDLEAVRDRLPADQPESGAARREIQSLREAFSYSDPMSNPALEPLEAGIRSGIARLGELVQAGELGRVGEACNALQQQLKDRNRRTLALK